MHLRHRLLFAALYFSQGAPIGWLWWALPSQLRQAGVEVDTVTAMTAALAVPWACKFLWAPLVDVLRTRWFGVRSWLVAAQLGMAATLVPLLGLDLVAHWDLVFVLLLAHAFCAATQDVAIDALAIATVPAAERGRLNGAMQVGQIGGRVLFSSGILYLEAETGERPAVPLLLGVLAVTLTVVWMLPPERHGQGDGGIEPSKRPGRRRRYLRVLLRTPRFWRLVAFALLGGAGFEAAGALSGSLLVDRGLDTGQIGDFRLVSAGAMALGAMVGGRLGDRLGPVRVARGMLLLVAGILALAAALGGVSPLILLYAAIGAFTAASYAVFMGAATGPLAATVFSGFMGLTNMCEAWSGRLAGALHSEVGYGGAMLVLGAVSLLAWPLLRPRRAR